MSRPPGLLVQYIQSAGERIASDPDVPPEHRNTLARRAEQLMWQQWRDMFGCEPVRLRAPDQLPERRRALEASIAQALLQGVSYREAARRAGTSHTEVRRFARRIGGTQ